MEDLNAPIVGSYLVRITLRGRDDEAPTLEAVEAIIEAALARSLPDGTERVIRARAERIDE